MTFVTSALIVLIVSVIWFVARRVNTKQGGSNISTNVGLTTERLDSANSDNDVEVLHPGYDAIERAKLGLLAWAKEAGIPIRALEYVATFESWDDGIGVWIFYETNADLESAKVTSNGLVRERLLAELRAANYPFKDFPEISFEFDSHENVEANYQGNYYYRLR